MEHDVFWPEWDLRVGLDAASLEPWALKERCLAT